MWGSDFVVKRSWHPKVQRALYFGDFLAIAIAVIAAHLIRFGWENADLPYVNVWPINAWMVVFPLLITFSWASVWSSAGGLSSR